MPKFKKYLKLLFFSVLFFSISQFNFAQENEKKYSQNFVLKGVIANLHKDSILSNGCVWVIAFYRIRTVKTNAKGEFEIKFYDTTGSDRYESFPVTDGEISFIWCKDPNRTKSVFLKKTKVKKSKNNKYAGKPPVMVNRFVLLEYEFEKKRWWKKR